MTTLQIHISVIQQGIKTGQFSNEAAVSQGIVLRLLQALSWPTYDIQIVYPKYTISGNTIDYALCNPPTKPIVFIEIIQGNLEEEQENHILANADHAGAPITILTNGTEWYFYLTNELDLSNKRLFYKLHILENSVGEIVQHLHRYLDYDTVCSGKALEGALSDYKFEPREHHELSNLSEAWSILVKEQDESLVALIADEVEKRSGHRPNKDMVLGYLAKLSNKKMDVSDPQVSQSSAPRAGKFFYWLFAITPILLHVVINLSLWCHLPNQNVNDGFWCRLSDDVVNKDFLYYIKFVWFVPAFWVLMNIGGLWQGHPQDSNKHRTWDAPNALLIVSYVSKGVNQEALYRSVRQARWILDLNSMSYTIEVVSDIPIAEEKRILPTKGPVYYDVVPEDYHTKTKVEYKARALQYLLEQRTNRLVAQKEWNINDVWVLHLDEESVLTQQAVMGIEKFIIKHSLQNSEGAIGQGEILYNSHKYGENLLITAADALRTGDDLGRFRFQYKVMNKPLGGIHGSFLLTPAIIEQNLSWDSGSRSQLTEDAYFGLKAMEKKLQFDWIEGFIKEQSPFTWKDFVNQRVRWFCGLALVVTDNKLKLSTRWALGITIMSWSVAWIGTFATFGNFVVGWITEEGFFPFWAVLSTSILAGSVGSVYMLGTFRNVSHWAAPIWRKIYILLATYFLFLFQILPLMEALAVIRGVFRLIGIKIFNLSQDFYVVAKD